MSTPIIFNAEKVKNWYMRDDIYHLITSFNAFKYNSFMVYKSDGTTFPPRRFITIIPNRRKAYEDILRYVGLLTQPTSFYRDVDCWKITRPLFSLIKEKYKQQRADFFGEKGETKFREHIFSSDFIIDVDGKDVYDAWETASKITKLFLKFNVMFSIFCSGKKGFQILVPYNKCPKKNIL